MSYFHLIRINKVKLLLILSGLLIAISLLINYSSEWDRTQIINELEIVGNNYLKENEILFYLKDSIVGQEKSSIVLEDIENAVIKNPYIKQIWASFQTNKLVRVRVEERVPIAYLEKRGDILYIDEEFKILPYRVFKVYTDLPLFYGRTKDIGLQKSLVELIEIINNEDSGLLKLLISEIHLERNNLISLVTNDGLNIRFGRMENIKKKLEKLLVFWETKLSQTDLKSINYIDITWLNKVIVKST